MSTQDTHDKEHHNSRDDDDCRRDSDPVQRDPYAGDLRPSRRRREHGHDRRARCSAISRSVPC
jgi:hypothetical protein